MSFHVIHNLLAVREQKLLFRQASQTYPQMSYFLLFFHAEREKARSSGKNIILAGSHFHTHDPLLIRVHLE